MHKLFPIFGLCAGLVNLILMIIKAVAPGLFYYEDPYIMYKQNKNEHLSGTKIDMLNLLTFVTFRVLYFFLFGAGGGRCWHLL